jgi:GDP-4-dehydro-6-deoxy-D-mannose reductase
MPIYIVFEPGWIRVTNSNIDQRILITGASGFVGKKLVEALRQYSDFILICPYPASELNKIGDCLDITQAQAVVEHMEHHRPDIVIHLAGISAVTASISNPRQAWDVNLGGTLNIVLAMQRCVPDSHLLYVSSAEVYGSSFATGLPISETAILNPVNPYAASKAAADILVRQAAAAGLSATVMRPFNHIGSGQDIAFVVPSFADQIARIEAGLSPPVVNVGALDEERDFLDVSDVVSAYVLAIRQHKNLVRGDVFNIASGVPIKIGYILDVLISISGISPEIHVESSRIRPANTKRVLGDASYLRTKLGWSPKVPLDETLTQVLLERRAMLKFAGRQ